MTLLIVDTHKESVNIPESKSSSETLAALSILHLIRFFDANEAKLDTSVRLASPQDAKVRFEPETSIMSTQPGQTEEENESEGNKNEGVTNLENSEGLVADVQPESEIPQTPAHLLTISPPHEEPVPNPHKIVVNEDLELFQKNFRPREPKLSAGVLPEIAGVKRNRSISLSLNAMGAKRWVKRSASLFFPDREAVKKSKESTLETSLEKENGSAAQKSGPKFAAKQPVAGADWSYTVHPLAKRVSSLFLHRKQNAETELEDMVFSPKTHRPLVQDFPTVNDVEDIADANAEYSVLPEEWSGYLDPNMKSTGPASGATPKPKRTWEKWFSRPVKLKALRKKIKSSFASGKRKTMTLKVRFFTPAAKPDGPGEKAEAASPAEN